VQTHCNNRYYYYVKENCKYYIGGLRYRLDYVQKWLKMRCFMAGFHEFAPLVRTEYLDNMRSEDGKQLIRSSSITDKMLERKE